MTEKSNNNTSNSSSNNSNDNKMLDDKNDTESFEYCYSELEKLVEIFQKSEEHNMKLNELVTNFEKAHQLRNKCITKLNDAVKKINLISKNNGENINLEEVDIDKIYNPDMHQLDN